MKKLLKILGGIVLGIVALALVLVLTLPLWLGPVVKPAANSFVPKLTKTSFNLGHLSLNPYTGRFELGDMQLGNPEGYSEKYALTASNIVLDVAMTTLGDKYVHVEEVTVAGIFLSYQDGGEHGVNNFEQIQYNVAGGKEKYEAAKAKAEAEKSKKAAEADADAAKLKERLEKMSAEERERYEAEKAAEEAASKKFVVDKLTIGDIMLVYGKLPIPVPVTITLTDLGKESDGLTMSELADKIWEAILKSALAIGDGAKALGGLLKSGAGAVGEGAGKAVGAVGDGASKLGGAVSDGAGKAVDAVSDGAGKAVDAVSEGAGKAVDAVSEGAGKAVDAVKGLFK
ncbi:MAG: hypothetical protein J6T51_08145 [Kiritimatiellae bacterium]|nr:hypothetical protein [Kiritimatiellia bacterium]